jgi:hypothetical protein
MASRFLMLSPICFRARRAISFCRRHSTRPRTSPCTTMPTVRARSSGSRYSHRRKTGEASATSKRQLASHRSRARRRRSATSVVSGFSRTLSAVTHRVGLPPDQRRPRRYFLSFGGVGMPRGGCGFARRGIGLARVLQLPARLVAEERKSVSARARRELFLVSCPSWLLAPWHRPFTLTKPGLKDCVTSFRFHKYHAIYDAEGIVNKSL